MLLLQEKLEFINTIAHEGKVVVIATDTNGKIFYTIKQDGFEDSYLNTPEDQRTGWEDWQELEFPDEAEDDQSVIDKETAELTHQDDPNKFILRSRYRTQNESAAAPVQLVSGMEHIYVFRQSKANATETTPNTLLVDRFVLDGMTNQLVRKLDVRFKRSRKKYQPIESMKKKANGGLANIDSLDFRDADGEPFYEPTTELSLITNLHKGWFSVVLLPTNEHEKYRWHIFAYNSQTQKIELTTIGASEEGLFDIKDYTILEQKPEAKNALVPRSIPGIIHRTLDINNVEVADGFSATKYDIQREQQTREGMQLLKNATKIMLAIPTKQGNIAALSFAVAADGTLAEIDENPDSQTILRSNSRDLLLPLNTLDEIKGIGDSTPPPQGTITAINRGDEDTVQITSPEAADLITGDIIEITDTQSYDGHYVATAIDEDTFEIETSYVDGDIGRWEVVPEEETGLIFDGAITAFERVENQKLRITAFNHGLEDGDEVQIINTSDYNRTLAIQKLDEENFVVNGISWQPGEAVNLKLKSRKRRGVMFNGGDQKIAIPAIELTPPSTEFAFGYTISAWVYVSQTGSGEQIIVWEKEQRFQLLINNGTVTLKARIGNSNKQVTDTATIPTNQWVHYAGVIASDGASDSTTLTLCKNGQQLGTPREFAALPNTPENWQPEFEIGKSFVGKIADVQIWDKVRTVQEIKDSMYLQLTGREVDLVGYWRLGAITKDRKVVDFSAYGNDGVVHGDAFVSAITLSRTLGDNTTQVVKYSNDDLVAVSGGATYVETFEFKTAPHVNPNNVNGNKLFSFSYWGKTSRSAEQKMTFSGADSDFVSLGNNWYQATCRVTVPYTVAMMRAFEIADIQGSWSTLEIRKHGIQLVSDSITEVKSTDSVTLTTLADSQAALPSKLKELEQKEQEEALLLKEKRELEQKIANLNLGDVERQAAINAKQSEISNQQTLISNLEAQKNQLFNTYRDEQNNKLNYWCKLVCRENENWIARIYTASKGLLHADVGADGNPYYTNNKFKFVATSNGYYRIVSLYENRALYGNYKELVYGGTSDGSKYEWKPESLSNGYYLIRQRASGGVLDRGGGEYNVCIWPEHQKSHQQWKIIQIGGVATNNISNARSAYERKEREWNQAKQHLITLQNELALLQLTSGEKNTTKAELEDRLQEVIAELTTVQSLLNTLNNNLLNDIVSIQVTPQTMPEVAKDNKELVTKGAFLGFASAASRVTAIETCEGNVQLSYFDHQGRMRLTNYDATSDSQNTTFEQWVADELPVALKLSNTNSKIELLKPISLPNEWTIETWFSYPLPKAQKDFSLEEVLEQLNQDYQSITNLIPNRYEFSDGVSGTAISDGGRDMYDGGNLLRTNLGGSIPYSNNTIAGSQYVGGNGRYFTRKYPGLFVFIADVDGVNSFEITGNLGADSHGSVDGIVLNTEVGGVTFSGFVKRVYGTTDPSVNHLVILENNGSATHQFSTNTDHDQHLISNISGTKRIYYLLYAGGTTEKIDDTQTQSIMNAFLNICVRVVASSQTLITTIDGERIDVFTENNNAKLGIFLRNQFYDSGYNLEELSVGWHHLTAVGKESTTKFYINGKEVADVQQAILEAETDEDTRKQLEQESFKITGYFSTIGNSISGSQQFGKISEYRIWNIALSDAEIAINSKTRLTGNEPGLVAYYPLNEATGTEVRDLTGSGNNGTVFGGTWWGCTAPIGNLGHQVMEFNGEGDYISPNSSLLNNLSSFTIEGWIKPASLPNASLFGQNDAIEFGFNSEKKLIGWVAINSLVQTDYSYPVNEWHHVALVGNGSKLSLYIDGVEKTSTPHGTVNNYGSSTDSFQIGAGVWSGGTLDPFHGQMAEVRVWNKARSAEEIKADMRQRLTGQESGLLAYFPLNEVIPDDSTKKVLDLSGNEHHGTVNGAMIKGDNTLPIGSNAVVSAEYSTIGVEKITNKKYATMRRFLASPALNGAELLPDKRIEELELKWIGNAQFAPTLLGYIEGAPPVPSENLSVKIDYNNATSVEVGMSEDVAFSWNRYQEVGLGASVNLFMGASNVSYAGLGVMTKASDIRAGFKGNLDLSYNFLNQTSVSSSSSITMTDRLELRGSYETGIQFPHLGQRFIPKNVGYALVVSSLADVFITRLKRTKKMIGYQVQPVDGIPPDINTITFLINPTYTMNGSLDGMTGSSASSDRFFRHVPEMRDQYGSLYPASYYRLQEAYNLKQKIENEDKRRESYFAQFNALLVDEASLEREASKGEAPSEISLEREEDKPDENMTEEERKEQEAAEQKQREEEARSGALEQSDAAQQKQAEISSRIQDQDSRVHATDSFAGWQRKMESIQIRAGKRNIVNNYVWDADGGLRTEAQSFANTAEHTIGGSFDLYAGLGLEGNFGFFGAAVELTAQATVKMTQTMTKTESRSKGFQLYVDLSGVESIGITDADDYPIRPGEKVDRYRFMSFYLEGSTKNFNDFFDYVVDPEWLASNDEEARALRQARGKANKTWRVLHRVTYVERPALMGFGRDIRKQQDPDQITAEVVNYFDSLEGKNQSIQGELADIRGKLTELKSLLENL
ncbi:MAG: LamG domain-containing protein [Okeania sp. SIO2C2]|uniref:LamG-like jellyroll fold domain-containing protein n=1 Tax=Okeania sp. SIO2C2 TaxID=2607787 RepID=UPI0013BCD5A3|nr:LamG-like jellyroll fold domain-containing protein [Okeania sp. SIO2C2]NEP86225.1 LamG domain-containing protein [Okeania sp. SIO2C2]